jgi:hypothetical protein
MLAKRLRPPLVFRDWLTWLKAECAKPEIAANVTRGAADGQQAVEKVPAWLEI